MSNSDRSNRPGAGASGPHQFVPPEDSRITLALQATNPDYSQVSAATVANASLRPVSCAVPGCGKPKSDRIHWMDDQSVSPGAGETEGHAASVGSIRVLVAYGSRHGATRGIAERIAARLAGAGFAAEAVAASLVKDPAAYDAFVVGGAAYMFRWHKEALVFVRHNRGLLASHPAWLFTSGPIGESRTDPKGGDLYETSFPREFAELRAAIHPLDTKVFFGALDFSQAPQGLGERFVRLMPAARASMPQGDFREWDKIDAWADTIAAALRSRA